MFSNRPTKKQLRQEHDRKIAEFLANGGEIQKIRAGATGLVDGSYNTRHIRLYGSKTHHTPLKGVTAAIDARKHKKAPTKPAPKTGSYARVIFDDFGEPVRTVWVHQP